MWFLVLGLCSLVLGPLVAILSASTQTPAKAALLSLLAYLLGLSAGLCLGWLFSELIDSMLLYQQLSTMPDILPIEPIY